MTRETARRVAVITLLVAILQSLGCQALTNPVANGIPVRLLDDSLLVPSKTSLEPVPLEWLSQPKAETYSLAPGDILGVYVDGIVGDKEDLPPVQVLYGRAVPAVGEPIAVRPDGTLPLPLIDPIYVTGKTIDQVERDIKEAYTRSEGILKPERKTRILVSLLHRRTIQVHVVRQDAGWGHGRGIGSGDYGSGDYGRGRYGNRGNHYGSEHAGGRGTATLLDLPAQENDLMHALTQTGGLPGLDAVNAVEIRRARLSGSSALNRGETTLIPLRVEKDKPKSFTDADITLNHGDIVFIGRRESDYYYTSGMLGNRKVLLPRDYDLRVLEAVIQSGGPLVNGSFSANNLSGAISSSGVGTPNPSLLSIVRQTTDGRQVLIKVDLNRALTDVRENIILKNNDLLILQESHDEAYSRYFSSAFGLNFFGRLFDRGDISGSASLVGP